MFENLSDRLERSFKILKGEGKNYPFYDWVPKPLGIIFMIILFVPMITMSGVYSAMLYTTVTRLLMTLGIAIAATARGIGALPRRVSLSKLFTFLPLEI